MTNNDDNLNGEISMKKKFWTKIYEKTHRPCVSGYKELDLSSNPIVLKPGQVRGIYIHSTRRGDAAIVYDNKVKQKTHDDGFITILPGRAHVSETAFGSVPIWGWYVPLLFCARHATKIIVYHVLSIPPFASWR